MDELIFLKANGGSRVGGEEQIEVLSVLEREKTFRVCQQLKEGRETQTVTQQTAAIHMCHEKYFTLMLPGLGFHFTLF